MDFIPLRRARLPTAGEITPYLARVDQNLWYTNQGPLLLEFEQRLAAQFGCQADQLHVVASATAALTVALLAYRPFRGRRCVMPSFTFAATPTAAVGAGLEPFFADIDPDRWCLTPGQAYAAVESAGGVSEVAAVIPVSAYGSPIDMDCWETFSKDTGIPVVIDAAWCFDTAKAEAVTTCISLHATKVFGVGEGGIILDRESGRVALMRRLANFGITSDRISNWIGINGKLSEYGAAVGLAGMDSWAARRSQALELQQWYVDDLDRLPGITLLPGFDNSWVGATIALAAGTPLPASLNARMAHHGIEVRNWWGRPCHEHPAFEQAPRSELPATQELQKRLLNLPFYPGMLREDVRRVVDTLRLELDRS